MKHIVSSAPVLLGPADAARAPHGPIALVEASYALDGTLQDWLAGVVARAPFVTPRLGVVGLIQRSAADTLETAHLVAKGSSAALDFLATVQARHLETPFADYFASPLARAGSMVAQGVAAGLPSDFVRLANDTGAVDALGLYANLGDGWYITILAPSDALVAESRKLVSRWVRMSAHLAAGLRLRRRLLQLDTLPEITLTPSGEVLHVDPHALDAPAPRLDPTLASARASQAVHAVARARGPMGVAHPDAALSIWHGLMAGRWSLADRVEPGGRRVVVAYRNEPDLPRPALLTAREAAVARHAADGAALKEIAWSLGIAISTVHATLARAMTKLRVATRAELSLLVRAALTRPLADVARVPLSPADEPLAALSPAEREVAGLVLTGAPVREIARRRGTSERTVAHQLTAIYAKLGVGSRSELAARVHALALACDDLGTPDLAAPPELQGALEADDVVFIGKKFGSAFGDFVPTADPKVVIRRVDAPAVPVVTFVRRPSGPNAERVERIKAVLQDDLDAPADTDLDLNPVGYFQVRWATTGLAANKTYRVQVSLPDGRVAGEVDVFLAARPRDLPTNVVGFVVGKNVQLRFRIDSDTVDRDHDTLLDWGDNCPDVPNHDQADADGDGLGDACDCPVADCPPNQRFDETTCGCVCAPCGPGHVIVDPIACSCGCDPRTSDPTCAGAPDGFVFDPSTCECACPDLICPAGRVADPDKCACVCAPNTCTGSQVQDPLTCGCACPQLLGPGVLDPCAGLGQGAVFDPVKCTCGCPDLLCPPGSVPDTSACACRAIVLGAPDAPLDLTTAAVSLDRPPTSEVCDGIATTELTTRLEVAKPATRTLSFASSSDTCPGSTSPNAKNHADAIALPVTGTPGMDVRLEVLGEASLLFDPECWLVVRGVIDGEVTYRAARHDGQASGGGTYLPADTAERAYVFCTDRAGLALPNTLEVFLTLTPR